MEQTTEEFKQYRKKPVVIQAARITQQMQIETLEGVMTGNAGDWLIIGVAGERYPCKDHVFQQTYEEVAENQKTCEENPSLTYLRDAELNLKRE